MMLIKKLLFIFAIGFLPAVLLANQNVNSSPQTGKFSPLPAFQTTLLPIVSQPTANMHDISHPHNLDSQFRNSWMKDNQLQHILKKAVHTGQLNFVMAKLDQMHLPKSLALIPVIESEYSSGARSNKGASGIWQLMPATAKRFGVSNSDRYQLAPSTDAALKYLKVLHQKFGSWELAIAAYNAGEGRIQQALNRNPNAMNVQQLTLPKETKQYVLKFYQLEDYMAQDSTTV